MESIELHSDQSHEITLDNIHNNIEDQMMNPKPTALPLRLVNLHKTMGRRSVLSGVSLSLEPQEVCVLVGENGSGKSTLLSLVAGVLEPESGEIFLSGYALHGEREQALQTLGYAPERAELPDGLMVMEWLDLVASIKQQPMPTRQTFEHYHVESVIGQRLGTLSLGQMRRVLLMAAALGAPRLLVLDEPSNGLDSRSVDWLVAWLSSCSQQGSSVLMATHDRAFAQRVGTRVVELHDGMIKQTSDS
jgi:ABC-2 type transport system ATP-binding protein